MAEVEARTASSEPKKGGKGKGGKGGKAPPKRGEKGSGAAKGGMQRNANIKAM